MSPRRKKPKADPEAEYWRDVTADFKRERALTDVERDLDASRREAWSVGKFKGQPIVRGPGAKYLRALVGRTVFDVAEDRYGSAILIRAARRIAKARQRVLKERTAALEKVREALTDRGMTPAQVERWRQRATPRYRAVAFHYQKSARGPRAGQYLKYRLVKGKRVKVRWLTRKGKRLSERADLIRKRAAQVATAIGITPKEARDLLREVEAQAVLDLRAFKKTADFKRMSAKRKRGYTERRWKAGSVAAVYALSDIDGYS